ncbi:unnamed protein product [Microthlaspi erraticum]|uniref:Uncharacterized protein n=1 Tax=Microthlaspi erraticum TaxID=1685480 RepID=A0A6D2I058_9BRAS|nr:unnamed protein product [Microthlaspi erraticum]
MFRARPKLVRPTEVSAKVQTTRPITHHDPGNMSRGRPRHTPHHRARPKRASREKASRPRNRSRTTADASVRAGKNVPRPAENFIGQISSARPRRPTVNPSDPDRSDSATTRCPADRPARPSQRRGRPEALFEAQTYVFKPGLTLSRL